MNKFDSNQIADAIVQETIAASGLPNKEIAEYTDREHIVLERTLALKIYYLNLRMEKNSEYCQELRFRAGKDSSTSSMKPSSDMFREADKYKEQDSDTDEVAGWDSDKKGESGSDSDSAREASASSEEESEKKLRADHNRSRRTKSGRTVGRQCGEKGCGFSTPFYTKEMEERIVLPEKCKNCEHLDSCMANAKLGSVHNVYDVEIIITKQSFRTPEMKCPGEKNGEKGETPDHAKGPNQYGNAIRTMVALLYCVGMVSLNRIKSILAPIFGIKLSETTILSYIHLLAAKVEDTVKAILNAESESKVVHCDETGAKVDGKLCWIHCISTELYTFVSVNRKRGKEALDDIGFLATYIGTVVHDCWSSYWTMDQVNEHLVHAICDAHIERELAGLSKFFKNAAKWAVDMSDLLKLMLKTKHRLVEKNVDHMPSYLFDLFSKEYDDLISRGKELHPLPERKPGQRGRLKKGRARCLIDRMEERKADVLRFATDFEVPYTNNCAEQCFRLLGLRKNVGIFRTMQGAEDFCLIWSYISSARKHGISYYKAIKEAFEGKSFSVLFGDGDSFKEHKTTEHRDESKKAA